MDNEELLTIKYKGTDYSLTELIQNENNFAKSLELPKFLDKDYSSFYWAWQSDYGYLIATDKIKQFYSLMSTARFTLIEAYKKLHKSSVEWRSGYLGQLWFRVHNLKNAIIWYDSCDDYLLQILWFAFDLFNPHELKEPNDYIKLIKSCTWEKLTIKLKKLEHNLNAKILLEEIMRFRAIKGRLEVNELANSLKHRANIHFEGLDHPDDMQVTSVLGFDSFAVRPIVIDIDNACNLLKEVHSANIHFAKFIIDFIDFESALPPKKNNGRNMDEAPKKENYKKIIFNN